MWLCRSQRGESEELPTPFHTVVQITLLLKCPCSCHPLPLWQMQEVWKGDPIVDCVRGAARDQIFSIFPSMPLAEVQSPTISNSVSQFKALDFLRFSAEIAD